MAEVKHIIHKTDKQFLFEVQLRWVTGNKGLLSAADVAQSLWVALPKKFGGGGKEWAPEHLLLASLNSSYMTTLLAYAKKMKLDLLHFDCSAIGQISTVKGRNQFTHINLYPRVYVKGVEQQKKLALALAKTQRHCLVSNSLNTAIVYHTALLSDLPPEPDRKTRNQNSGL